MARTTTEAPAQLEPAAELEAPRDLRAPVRTRWDVGGLSTAEGFARLRAESERVCPKR